MSKNLQNGFSLIELSIVLIIIGLLVAGIVGGAALIASTRSRTIISEVGNYQQAVASYYSNRMKLPGDVNGSGKIGKDSDNEYSDDSNDYSCNNSTCTPFVDLADEGIIDYKTYHSDEGVSSKAYKSAYYRYVFMDSKWTSEPSVAGFDGNSVELETKYNGSISAKIFRMIDEATDDGFFDSGNMRASCFERTDLYEDDYTDEVSYDVSVKAKGKCASFIVKLNTFN